MTRSNSRGEVVDRRHRRSLRALSTVAGIVGAAWLLAACGGSTATIAEQTAPIQLLEPPAFEEYLEENPDIDLINVHVPYQGHIAGTDSFVNFEQIVDYDGLPDARNDPVVLYCRSGSMSGQAAADLVAAGYTNIIDLKGGMNAWTESGRNLVLEEPIGG